MELELENDPRFRNFDWEKAKNFYYVAKLGSFVNAGRFLNLSQSSLSRQISHLEQHLGCPLFSRHSGGVKLTRKGEELFSIIETTFIGLKGFTQNSHAKIANGEKRKIRILTTHAMAAHIFKHLLIEYNKTHPELVIELIGEDHFIDIVLYDVDIAIRPLDVQTQDIQASQGIRKEYLFSLERRLYASPEYLAKYGEPQTVEELRYHHIIAFGHPEVHPYADVNWILRLGMPEGELHEPVFISNSVDCMVEAARNGMGIVGSYEEMNLIKSSSLRNILPTVKDKEIKQYFIYPSYLKKDKDIIEIKNYLHDVLTQEKL